jgi:hypothetical protein
LVGFFTLLRHILHGRNLWRLAMKAVAAALAVCTVLAGAGPVVAGTDDVDQRIDPDTLPPALRREAMTAPLGFTGPFGEPTPAGCKWSRIQLMTTQGVKWFIERQCDNQEDSGP